MQRHEDMIKLGAVNPREGLGEIEYHTDDGGLDRLTGFVNDPDDPESMLATRYTMNLETGDAETHYGKIIGKVSEAGQYVWQYRKAAGAVTSLVVSVALGSLWVRHRNND